MFVRRIVASSLVAGALWMGAAVPAVAKAHDKCAARIRKAERKYDKARMRHGEHSRQADQARVTLERARTGCRERDRR